MRSIYPPLFYLSITFLSIIGISVQAERHHDVVALYTESTPESVYCGLRQVSDWVTVMNVNKAGLENTEAAECVIDAMFQEGKSLAVKEEFGVGAKWINANPYETEDGVELFARTNKEAQMLGALINELKIEKLCIVLSLENAGVKQTFYDRLPGVMIADFVLTASMDLRSLSLLLRKEVKSKNFINLLFATSEEETTKLMKALFEAKMTDTSMTFFYTQEAARSIQTGLYRNFTKAGVVFVGEEGCELVNSKCDFIACKIEKIVHSHGDELVFSILNMRNDIQAIIGRISENGTVSLCEDCVYLRAEATFEGAHLTPIQLSFNNATMNPDGDTNGGEREFYFGVDLAVMDINSRADVLPGFSLHVFNVTFGLSKFNLTWALNKMKGVSKRDMGLVFLHGHYSNVAVPSYHLLAETLNYSLPQVGSDNTSPVLSSTKNFPAYTRVTMSNYYLSALYINTLKRYGWKRISILYCDDLFCTGLYAAIVDCLKNEGIAIENPEATRQLPAEMREYPVHLIPILKAIVASKVKIFMVILYGSTLFYTLDVLYDIGVRREDFMYISIDWLNPTLFRTGTDAQLEHRKELLHGALQFYPTAFAGNFGQRIKQSFKEVFGVEASHFACNNYDGVLLIAHAIDYLAAVGGDYENPDILMKELRRTRFVGCTGDVQNQEGTNDRAPMTFQIMNAFVTDDGIATIREIGTYNPTGLLLFNFTAPVIWPDNTTNAPGDMRVSSINCPFDVDQIVVYVPGRILANGIVFLLALTTVVISIIMWRKFWNLSAEQLTEKVEISFDDYVFFTTIAIESLQYAAMGPEFASWTSLIAYFSSLLSWELSNAINLSHGVFWIILNITFGGMVLWVVFLIVIKYKLNEKWRCVCEHLGDVGEKLLPILGNLCFLPFTSMMMNVFQCDSAVSSDDPLTFTDSFLKQDCYQHCWESPHYYYAASAIIGLIIYVPLAVYLRPIWQLDQPTLHIHTAPSYLMIKTIYQVSIIAAHKVLIENYVIAHFAVFIFLTILFAGFTIIWRPFGYSRANMWHFLSFIGLLWLELISTLNLAIATNSDFIWFALFFTGVGVILAFGVLYQFFRLPSLLFRPKGVHVVDLFKFQFSKGKRFLYLFKQKRMTTAGSGDATPIVKWKTSCPSPGILIP